MERNIELELSAEYDLSVDKTRTLKSDIYCYYYSGTTTVVEYPFNFDQFTGATMSVKNKSGTQVMTFSTSDGSLTLGTAGKLSFYKTWEQMDKVRPGIYDYDMYISSAQYPKRGFLRGKIEFYKNIAY